MVIHEINIIICLEVAAILIGNYYLNKRKSKIMQLQNLSRCNEISKKIKEIENTISELQKFPTQKATARIALLAEVGHQFDFENESSPFDPEEVVFLGIRRLNKKKLELLKELSAL